MAIDLPVLTPTGTMIKQIVAYAAIEDSDKPEHPRSLIGAFVVRYGPPLSPYVYGFYAYTEY